MSGRVSTVVQCGPLAVFLLIQSATVPVWALPRTWIGGNVD